MFDEMLEIFAGRIGLEIEIKGPEPESVAIAAARAAGIEVHAWDVNDPHTLNSAMGLRTPRICTDRLVDILSYRQQCG